MNKNKIIIICGIITIITEILLIAEALSTFITQSSCFDDGTATNDLPKHSKKYYKKKSIL